MICQGEVEDPPWAAVQNRGQLLGKSRYAHTTNLKGCSTIIMYNSELNQTIRYAHQVCLKRLAAKAGNYLVIKIPCEDLSATAAAPGSVKHIKVIV